MDGQTYGGTSHDGDNRLIALDGGGMLLAGYVTADGMAEQLWLARVDPLPGGGLPPTPTWERIEGGPDDDRANAVVRAPGGGFLLGGETRSNGGGKDDLWPLRTDDLGNVLWERTFGGPAQDEALDAAAPSFGSGMKPAARSGHGLFHATC